MLRLEFEHYDMDQDETILGIDFARSILSAVNLGSIDMYLDRAANLLDKHKNCRVRAATSQLTPLTLMVGESRSSIYRCT